MLLHVVIFFLMILKQEFGFYQEPQIRRHRKISSGEGVFEFYLGCGKPKKVLFSP